MNQVEFVPATEIQDSSFSETDEVNGAWIANAVGAALGAYGGAASGYVMSGGNWGAAAAGAAMGAAVGAINPIAGANQAGRAITNAAVGMGAGALAAGAVQLSN
ncbi:MAG: hypothetical protein K5821_15345 [Nitrobacter sp.]|uniref:hypothetical protein n=1 Tax=Nitrobacter sp. TaxID=29420 RepID=UPI002617E93C|nr:hypothetical protein [Nitrobacter sp.]MCV0387759.1 hypothetical protein [Nitrobacter sp.]